MVVPDVLSKEKSMGHVEFSDTDLGVVDQTFLDDNVGITAASSLSRDAIKFHELVFGMASTLKIPSLSVQETSQPVFANLGALSNS